VFVFLLWFEEAYGGAYLSQDNTKLTTYIIKGSRGQHVHITSILDDNQQMLLHSGMASYHRHITALFESARAYSYVVEFSSLALQFHVLEPNESAYSSAVRTDILSRLFTAATATSRYDVAHSALQSMPPTALQTSSLARLVDHMTDSGHGAAMLALPFGRLMPLVDDVLLNRCQRIDTPADAGVHQLLYAWRVRYHDYRGAATVLLERIQRLRRAGDADRFEGDGMDTPVTRMYLLLINALSCVEPAEAWVLAEEETEHTTMHEGEGAGADESGTEGEESRRKRVNKKRRVVTLEDVRREYQRELDRVSVIQNNQFALGETEAVA